MYSFQSGMKQIIASNGIPHLQPVVDQSRLGVRQTLQTDGVEVELAGAGRETCKCKCNINMSTLGKKQLLFQQFIPYL